MTPAQPATHQIIDQAALNRIEILQWRMSGDDEDALDFRIIPAHAATNIKEVVAQAYGVEFLDQDDPPTFVIAEESICDGEQLTAPDGRKYLVTITEILEPKTKVVLLHGNRWTTAELTHATVSRELEEGSMELVPAQRHCPTYVVPGRDDFERLEAADDYCRACGRAMKHEDLCRCGHGPECHIPAQRVNQFESCGADGCACQKYTPVVPEVSGV